MNFGTPRKRKLLREHRMAELRYYELLSGYRRTQRYQIWGDKPPNDSWQPYEPIEPSFPVECIDMRCGAKTRSGGRCKNKSIYRNGRCKFHGGLSTGPKTAGGKAKSALNNQQRKCIKDRAQP